MKAVNKKFAKLLITDDWIKQRILTVFFLMTNKGSEAEIVMHIEIYRNKEGFMRQKKKTSLE